MAIAFPTNTYIKTINSIIVDNYNAAYQKVEKQSNEIVTVIQTDSSSPTLTLFAPRDRMKLFKGSNLTEKEQARRLATSFNVNDYKSILTLNKSDLKDDRNTKCFASLGADLGSDVSTHDDVLAAMALEGGYTSDRALWDEIDDPTVHLYGHVTSDVISAAHSESGVNQSNMISGSAGFTPELLADACDQMRSFTNDKGFVMGVQPQFLVYHPSQTKAMKTMTELRLGIPGSTTKSLENINLYANQGVIPISLDTLKNPRAMWLIGSKRGMSQKPILIANQFDPVIQALIEPTSPNVVYDGNYEWIGSRTSGYAIPIWQQVVRITA